MKDLKDLKRSYLYLASQMISIFGSGIVDYILIWYITLKSGSGLILSMSLVLTYLSKLSGAGFVEKKLRIDKIKTALIVSDFLTAIVSTIMAILVFYELDTYPLLLGVIAIRSVFTGIQEPCKKILLTELTPEKYCVKINGYNTAVSSLGSLIAPAFGALIIAHFSMSAALMLDFVTAIAAVSFLLCLKVNFEKLEKTEKIPTGKSGTEIKIIFFRHVIFTFFIVPITFLTPLLISRIYHEDVTKLACNEIAYSFGSIMCGLCIHKIILCLKKYMEFSRIGFCVSFFVILLAYVTRRFPLYCMVMFFGAFFINVFQIRIVTALQKESDRENRTSVFSKFEMLTNIALPVGMLFWGSISDYITLEKSLLYSGIGLLIFSFAGKNLLERQVVHGKEACR